MYKCDYSSYICKNLIIEIKACEVRLPLSTKSTMTFLMYWCWEKIPTLRRVSPHYITFLNIDCFPNHESCLLFKKQQRVSMIYASSLTLASVFLLFSVTFLTLLDVVDTHPFSCFYMSSVCQIVMTISKVTLFV